MPDPGEHERIARARAGDRHAFADTVRRHQQRVFRYVLRLVGTREDALDLTQDTFLKAYLALPEWRPQARFGTWLIRIAHNAAIDLLRRRRAAPAIGADDDAALEVLDPAPRPDERIDARQRIALLEKSLQELPAEQRAVLLLREVEDLSYAEIAETLGVAEGTVKSRLARARAAVLAIYQRHTGAVHHEAA